MDETMTNPAAHIQPETPPPPPGQNKPFHCGHIPNDRKAENERSHTHTYAHPPTTNVHAVGGCFCSVLIVFNRARRRALRLICFW